MDGYGELKKPFNRFVHTTNQNLIDELRFTYPEITLTSLTPTYYTNIKEDHLWMN